MVLRRFARARGGRRLELRGKPLRAMTGLDEVSDIRRHLLDLCVVELLNIAQVANVSLGNEVYTDSFSSEAARSPNSVDIVFSVRWQVVVDDKRYLLKR